MSSLWHSVNKNTVSCSVGAFNHWVHASFSHLWPWNEPVWLMKHRLLSLTCVSVSMSEVATSKRLGLDRYLLSLNWFSSSSSCWLVKAVRGLRHFPNRPDWGPAGGGRAKLSVSWLHPDFTESLSTEWIDCYAWQCLHIFVLIIHLIWNIWPLEKIQVLN